MRRPIAALLLVAGCSSPGGAVDELAFEKGMASKLAFDPAFLKAGDYALYYVKMAGEARVEPYKWAVVAEDRAGVWVENKVPADPRPMIIKDKMERGGKFLERWVGEPGGIPGQIYPSPRGGKPAPEPEARRDSSTAQAQSKVDVDRIVVGGKSYDCTRVTTTLTYPDRRMSKMVNWFSKEVPFAGQKDFGGLVKRQFGRFSMELALFGNEAPRAELEIRAPEK